MKITLVPRAGLCNRLNAILSGLAYKEKHPDVELKILWVRWVNCNCRFKDLFQQLPSHYPPVKELITQIKDLPGHKVNLYLPQRLRHLWYDGSFLSGDNADDFDNITKGMDSVYVCKDNRFCKEEIHKSISNYFRPTEELQARINKVTQDWDKKYVIGLHIRRTDNITSINLSPIQLFYNVIEREMLINKDTLFYVATDDDSVKIDLQNRYGEHIITIPLCLKRSSVKGMKDAVVDLFCLGSTRKIYGSAHSTYSRFAAELFDIQVELVMNPNSKR